jgi:hypothetical protein
MRVVIVAVKSLTHRKNQSHVNDRQRCELETHQESNRTRQLSSKLNGNDIALTESKPCGFSEQNVDFIAPSSHSCPISGSSDLVCSDQRINQQKNASQ